MSPPDDDSFDDAPTPARNGRAGSAEARAHYAKYPPGTPSVRRSESVPIPLHDLTLGPNDLEYANRLRRHSDDPYVIAVKLAKAVGELRASSETSGEKLESALGEAVRGHERKLKTIERIAGAALALAIPALGVAIPSLLAKSGDDRETQVRIRVLEAEVERLRNERQPADRPSWPWTQQPRKDTP